MYKLDYETIMGQGPGTDSLNFALVPGSYISFWLNAFEELESTSSEHQHWGKSRPSELLLWRR